MIKQTIPMERCEITDMQTGEVIVIECADVAQLMQAIRGTARSLDKAILNATNSSPDEEFIQMAQTGLKKSSKDESITKSDHKVWEYCCGDVGFGGVIRSTQTQIAKELNVTPSRVNRAFKRLREAGMITANGYDKGTPTFRVADHYAIKGKRNLAGTDQMCEVIYGHFGKQKAS